VLIALSAPVVAQDAGPAPGGAAITAASLLEQARHQREAGRFEEAKSLCERALALSPGDIAIRDEISRIQAILPGGRPATVPADVRPDHDVQVQVAVTNARMAADQAELLSATGRDEEAAATLEPAIAGLLQLGPELANEARDELRRLESLSGEYRRRDRQQAQERGHGQRVEALVQAKAESAREDGARRSVFQERLARIEAIRKHGHLEVALGESRRLVGDYPREAEAERLFDSLLSAVHEQRRLSIEERNLELRKEVMHRIELSLIPSGSDGMPVYPADFYERHLVRTGLESTPAEPEWKLAIRDRLSKRVTFNFDSQNASEALEALAREAGVNLVIDPQLQAGGERVVTIKASNMRLDHAFDWLTRLMDTHWSVTKGAIYIGGEVETEAVLAIHDISVMTYQATDQAGKVIAFSTQSGAGGMNLFKDDGVESKKITPEEVVDLLQKSVSPLTWKNEGYGITIRGTTLLVSAPASVHRLIDEFIRAQEHTQSLVVKVDARWLTIADSFLEEIGVNWGAVPLNRNIVLPPVHNDGLYRDNGTYEIGASSRNSLPPAAVTIQPQTAGSGLNLSSVMLGNTQLVAVFTAIERNGRGRFLECPSITTLNGVRANAFFGNQTAYIADYEVVSSNLDPKIEVLTTGANLNIKPFISADRKYVSMDFRPGISSAQFYTETLSAYRFIGTNLTGFVDGPFPYPLELPNLLVRETSTTLQVPDQGTILVGGFGRHIDQEAASRIPFLGNIPFIGRLFGQRGRYSQRSQLYLLATVNIINYDELENTL
jgi:type II secretory pathway component GspD/PulD (secretin)